MSKTTKIACPFCGDHDDYNPSASPVYQYEEPGNPAADLAASGFVVECDKCGAMGPPAETEQEALDKFNKGFDFALEMAANFVDGAVAWGLPKGKNELIERFRDFLSAGIREHKSEHRDA